MTNVPFFRVELSEEEIAEVVATLRSGWLTTGPRVRELESAFAERVGAKHAIALNSCTAALHVAVEALGLRAGDVVLVPTLTFAATAEVVRYSGAIPLLVDCDSATGHMSLEDARSKIRALRDGQLPASIPRDAPIVGMIPVHYGGAMMDPDALRAFGEELGLWVVEDAAHAFPAAFRRGPESHWVRCGERTAAVSCFSFYANKTMTTGEGGMAVTSDDALAERMRLMSLHGLSKDAWARYSGGRSWDYRIVAPGFKYNMTDVAGALGVRQLERAEPLREQREQIALEYRARLGAITSIELPPFPADRVHSWHLFPIRLRLERLDVDRNTFVDLLRDRGVSCSVHYRPLHLHPYYAETFGWRPEHLPVASREWERLVTLPLFAAMRRDEIDHVVSVVTETCEAHAR